jgi:mono/diheme cytochrome c family protein
MSYDEEKETPPQADELPFGIFAEYDDQDQLIDAAKQVRDKGYERWDTYTPYPVHGIDPAMGIKRTKLPWIVLCAGVTGMTVAVGFQWWANGVDYQFITSGKPFWSLPANIPITFELTVLFSAITSFLSMLIMNGLPKPSSPLDRVRRFARVTDDRFFLVIETADPKYDEAATRGLLEGTGASVVEAVPPDPSSDQLPKGFLYGLLILAALSVIPFGLFASARAGTSPKPPYHIVPNMDFQAKYKPQRVNEFFADSDERAMREPVEGTVAVGELHEDKHLYEGLEQGAMARTFPEAIEISAETMARGQRQFGIFCTPCHGQTGNGEGMVHQRAFALQEGTWIKPTNIANADIIGKPVGELFKTISNGIRNMPGYGRQIPPEDRWAIILYLRALQRSQAEFASAAQPQPQQQK